MTAPLREPVAGVSVVRGTTASRVFGLSVLVGFVALFFLPMAASANLVQSLTSLFILVLLAASWNALAGYGGLVSVGQQAFIGLGAYGVIYLSKAGVSPYVAMLVAAVIAGLLSIPVSFLVFRFRGGQFAIATWVVAEAAALLIALDPSVGGGTGISLIALNQFQAIDRRAYTYWLALAGMAGFLFALFGLLRSRVGSALQAIRDDEAGAASVGVSVARTKRIVFLLAALGSAMAGVLTLANTQFIQPSSIFSVRWSALMIFMALVGGLGTIEGPIIGGIILYFLQDAASDAGAAYLIGLGLVAVLFALFLPRGIWGTLEGRTGIRLTPIGYRLVNTAVPAMASHDGHDKGQG